MRYNIWNWSILTYRTKYNFCNFWVKLLIIKSQIIILLKSIYKTNGEIKYSDCSYNIVTEQIKVKYLLALVEKWRYSFRSVLKFIFFISLEFSYYSQLGSYNNIGKAPQEFQSVKRGLQASYASNLQLHNRHHCCTIKIN